jgi:hypothetical protein
MQSRRAVLRVTRPDLVVPVAPDRAVRVPPDRVSRASAVITAFPPARDAVPTRPPGQVTRSHADRVTRPEGWPIAAHPAPSAPVPHSRVAPSRTRGPHWAAWLVAACLGALVVPGAIAVVLSLHGGGWSLPKEALFGSVATPATGESATGPPGLNGFGVPFVDPGLAPRVAKGGKSHWEPGYPGIPGFFLPSPSTGRRGGGKHKSHGGPGQHRNGNGGRHPGRGATPKPTHSPGGSHGSTPAPKPPSKTPKPVHSSPTSKPPASKPPTSRPPASRPPTSSPPASRPPASTPPSPRPTSSGTSAPKLPAPGSPA